MIAVVVLLTTECADPTETHIGSKTKNAPPDPIPAPTAVSRALPAELIYTIDPSGGDLVSNIVARDAVTGNTVRTYRVRYTPSIAFSPDGNTMFVTDSYRSHVTRGNMNAYISSFDTRTGSLLSHDVPLTERTRYKFCPIGDPMFFASDDGDVLFAHKYGEQNASDIRISVLDPSSFEVINES